MKRFVMLITVFLITAACSGEQYGGKLDGSAPLVTVKDIYLNSSLQNTLVNLEGTIISQCQSPDKCWYFMQDATGHMFVNLKPANFTLPDKIGKRAKVTGTVQRTKDGFQIIAQGVRVY